MADILKTNQDGVTVRYVDQGDGTYAEYVATTGGGGGGGASGAVQALSTQLMDTTQAQTTASVIHGRALGSGSFVDVKCTPSGALVMYQSPEVPAVLGSAITAAGGIVWVNCTDYNTATVSMVASTLVGHNATFEVSNDTTNGLDGNWYGITAARTNANVVESATGALAATPVYAWELSVNAWRNLRIRATAHTSGTATYSVQMSSVATEPNPVVSVAGTVPISGTITQAGQGAHSAAAAGNAVRVGSRVLTAHDLTLAANDASDHLATTAGQILVKPGGLTESAWNASVALTTTTAVALAAAGGASLKRHMTGLQAINTGAAAVDLIILDNATERWRMTLPPNVPVSFGFAESHLIVTANTALNVNLSAAGTVRVCAQGYTAP